MDSKQLFNLYEKQYYHEIEARDKLNSRLQIPLAILVAILGFLGFMLQNLSHDVVGSMLVVFWVLYFFASVSALCAIYFFTKSWFGHTDKLLPTAKQSEAYRNELIQFYSEYEKKDELVKEGMRNYLYNYYVEFSSINTTNNDSRAYNLYKMTVALTITTVLSFTAFLLYQLSGLDKNSHLKPLQVEILKLPIQETLQMTTNKPPSPPPPPPPRSVRGDIPIPKPKPLPTPQPQAQK